MLASPSRSIQTPQLKHVRLPPNRSALAQYLTSLGLGALLTKVLRPNLKPAPTFKNVAMHRTPPAEHHTRRSEPASSQHAVTGGHITWSIILS